MRCWCECVSTTLNRAQKLSSPMEMGFGTQQGPCVRMRVACAMYGGAGTHLSGASASAHTAPAPPANGLYVFL